jgi:hypothetical protein
VYIQIPFLIDGVAIVAKISMMFLDVRVLKINKKIKQSYISTEYLPTRRHPGGQ